MSIFPYFQRAQWKKSIDIYTYRALRTARNFIKYNNSLVHTSTNLLLKVKLHNIHLRINTNLNIHISRSFFRYNFIRVYMYIQEIIQVS